MRFIPPVICHRQSSRFAAASSQNRGQNWNATDAITDPTLPRQTADLGGDRRRVLRCALRARRNRAHVSRVGCEADQGRTETESGFGVPLEVRSRATRHLSTQWEAGSWMTASITHIEQPHRALHRYRIGFCSVTPDRRISCLKEPLNCEPYCSVRVSSRDALSEINTRRFARADFPFVFRNADRERVDVPARLRLAIPSHLQFAFAAR
jgi:hypothetical protein